MSVAPSSNSHASLTMVPSSLEVDVNVIWSLDSGAPGSTVNDARGALRLGSHGQAPGQAGNDEKYRKRKENASRGQQAEAAYHQTALLGTGIHQSTDAELRSPGGVLTTERELRRLYGE